MPVRGRPERPRTSSPASFTAQGQGAVRESEFGIAFGVDDDRFVELPIRFGVADQQDVPLDLRFGVADQKQISFGVGFSPSDVDGTEKTVDLFGIGFSVGDDLGYAAAPRVATPNAISMGQEVIRRGEALPPID